MKTPENKGQNTTQGTRETLPAASISSILGANKSARDAFLDGNPAVKTMGSVKSLNQYFMLTTGQWSADAALYDLYEEMLAQDPHIYGLLDSRIDAVTNRKHAFAPASQDPADATICRFVERCLAGRAFASLLEMLLRAIGRGLSVVEVDWKSSASIDVSDPDDPNAADASRVAQDWIVPARFIERHPALFVFDKDHEIYLAAGKKEKLDPRRLLILRYEMSNNNPYGQGILNRVYFYYHFKKICIRAWQIAVERFGSPTLLGKYKGTWNTSLQSKFLDVLEDIQGCSNVAIPDDVEINVLKAEAALNGETGPERLLKYLDAKIAVAFSGSTLTSSEGERSGSLALGQVHNEVRMEKIAGDARLLEDVINNQLIRRMVDLNFGIEFKAPTWAIDTDVAADLTQAIQIDSGLVKLGVPLSRQYFYEQYGRPAPERGELTTLHNDSDLFQYHLQYGVLTVNEVRARLGLESVSWGDIPASQVKLASADGTGQWPPAPAPAAPDLPAADLEAEDDLDAETDSDHMSEPAHGINQFFATLKKKSTDILNIVGPEPTPVACACGAIAFSDSSDPRALFQRAIAQHQGDYRAGRIDRCTATLKRFAPAMGAPQALRHAIQFTQSAPDSAPVPDTWIDHATLANDLALLWIVAYALEIQRQARELPPIPFAARARGWIPFRSEPAAAQWNQALDRFREKNTVPAKDFDVWLNAIEQAAWRGLLPNAREAQQQCYRETFTMVREANHKILDGVDKLLGKAISGEIGQGDFVQDVDDLYRNFGLEPQKGWYVQLVLDNASNRAYQEARDLVSHDYDHEAGKFTPKDWVWGYEWDHGNPARPRPSHLSMDGYKAPVESPIWAEFAQPPIGHGCLCTRWTIGRTRAEEEGLADRTDFPPPTVTRAQLEASGASAADIAKYTDKPAGFVLADRPGDRFERSNFNIPQRPFINPSGMPGEKLLVDSRPPIIGEGFPW